MSGGSFLRAPGTIREERAHAGSNVWCDRLLAIVCRPASCCGSRRFVSPTLSPSSDFRISKSIPSTASVDIASIETAIKYAGYLRRQESEIERARKDERRRIPAGFPFERVPGLSKEIVQRLSADPPGHARPRAAHPGRHPGGRRRPGGPCGPPVRVTSEQFQDRLLARAANAAVSIPEGSCKQLEAYFRLLALWNAKINLTALPLQPPTDETFDRLLIEPLAAARTSQPPLLLGSTSDRAAAPPPFP